MPVPATVSTDGLLIEVFSSTQGEGVLVGCRQIFVRLAGCNLACAYCDTEFQPSATFRVERTPGSRHSDELPNPVATSTICNIVERWQHTLPHHSLSLTGGEPLLQVETLRSWLPSLAKLLPVHLETNGTLPLHLPEILPYLQWIAMDIKLASMTGQSTPWNLHRDFLTNASRVECQVKVIVGPTTPREEIEQAARLVNEVAPRAPLILQPVTRATLKFEPTSLLQMQAWALNIHHDVRVIPQTHHLLGVR